MILIVIGTLNKVLFGGSPDIGIQALSPTKGGKGGAQEVEEVMGIVLVQRD